AGQVTAVHDGGGYVVAWLEHYPSSEQWGRGATACIVTTRISLAGAAVPPRTLVCRPGFTTAPALGTNGRGSLLVWGADEQVVGALLDREGKLGRSIRLAPPRRAIGLGVAHDGTRYHVLWHDYDHARLLRVGDDGQPIDPAPVVLSQRADRNSVDGSALACGR